MTGNPVHSSLYVNCISLQTSLRKLPVFFYDPKLANSLQFTAPLDRPRLKKHAVPSKLPGRPTYLSSKQAPAREDPEGRERLGNQALEKVIEQSVGSHKK
ncbi:uncharacterized protein LOC126427195 isoform X8 [Schistocerca serialis cubense]|uniref:uncharacterized protein LOC126427195 isoform X7 n=1 Tax=Schistocerca serialis cubense TaxID=2023355 RepID=UPI00214F43F2|nr:uncharacterized protein LOC126427195 isoform X7 [Schistocerca serialis cubense]XP_049945388.1 uncharacterized protein LOC126427195 isoform X8 [Schistocerca serialis cubense]